MKGNMFWKFAYLCCALTGILAGYGIVSLAGVKENRDTKDSTLVREAGDSVFFDTEQELTVPVPTVIRAAEPEILPTETFTPTPVPTPAVTPAETIAPTEIPQSFDVLPEVPEITLIPEETASGGQEEVAVPEEKLPSLASHWIGRENTAGGQPGKDEVSEASEKNPKNDVQPEQEEIQETFTYPAKIFGQTPVINRSDGYVSYFEFCYDLIAMVEQEVAARGLNMNVLMTKFAVKALLCGVDIEKLDINAAIPRRLAALCLWLAAQVLNEGGCDTSSQSVLGYVTDISVCSSSEKKAIAYLYEQGVVKGYQAAGQRFYPSDGLKTEDGKAWLSALKQCWE